MQRLSELGLNTFPRLEGQWLYGHGPDSDIVISSRIRLARNIQGFPFATKMTDEQRQEIIDLSAEAIRGNALRMDLDDASSVDRLVLVERHLISKELANGDGPRSVFFGRGEIVSVMVNEEDHLRIQCVMSGFDLDRIWRGISRIDTLLERQLSYSFDNRYGFLTACPTNVGTGLRVSVMLHLPALTLKDHIDKVKQAVDSMNLAIRGLYGEGSGASGDFYQISNQATMGRSEQEIIDTLRGLIPIVLNYERGMRTALRENEASMIEDKVGRAMATLKAARRINVDETMQHLSLVRLGLLEGYIGEDEFSIHELNRLFVLSQPGHIQKHAGKSLTPDERDEYRAELIRAKLASDSVN